MTSPAGVRKPAATGVVSDEIQRVISIDESGG
jgi:hypothetical protein